MKLPRKYHLFWLVPLLLLAGLWLVPLPDSLLHPAFKGTTMILDRNGKVLYELRKPDFGTQKPIPLSSIPKSFLSALIAIEDRGFYSHPGISIRGILRAAWQDLTARRIVSGGSTITQQLVRNLLESKERTFLYKIKEAFLALKIEQKLTKDQILETYVNTAYFGHQAYGISAAAKTFFGKSPLELSVAECAFLAGLLQSPTALDPFEHMKEAKERQKLTLAAMRDSSDLEKTAYADALGEPLTLAEDVISIRAPHFVMWLLSSRPEEFTGTTTVKTTIDLNLQTSVERIVERNLEKLKERNVTSAAVVVMDARNGDILSMVGSSDYFDRERDGAVNVALSARQPGSALKPFTYALALAKGDTAATTVSDTEAQFFTQEGNPYTPRNYDFGYHGLVRYREALANSYNIAAVRVLERVGVPSLLTFLRASGISTLTKTPEHYGLALTLGDAEVKLLELTQAYGIFARAGRTLSPRALLTDPTPLGNQILDSKVAWLIANILSDNSARLPEFGEQSALAFDRPVAAKTGTTRNSRDNWTIGFTPDVLVGVWVGNADNSPMRDTSGVTGAGPIFHDVLLAASANAVPRDFTMPPGITKRPVCRLSGKLPTPLCPHTVDEFFIAGTEPKDPDDMYRSFPIDTRNGLLANKKCDQSFVLDKAFAVFPKDTEKWARENGWPSPPSKESPLCPVSDQALSSSQKASSWIEITRPQPNDNFKLDPLIPDSKEKIIFEAHASPEIASIDWFVNGAKVGTAKSPDFRFSWQPSPGDISVTAKAGTLSETVRISIVR